MTPCIHLAILEGGAGFCRHSGHHSRGNLVTEANCAECPQRDTPCATPRPVPTGEMIGKLPPPPGPSLRERASSWSAAIARWQAAGRPVRTDAQVEALLAICQACDEFRPAGGLRPAQCRRCGCRLNRSQRGLFNKLRMATESCPIGKWEAQATPQPQ